MFKVRYEPPTTAAPGGGAVSSCTPGSTASVAASVWKLLVELARLANELAEVADGDGVVVRVLGVNDKLRRKLSAREGGAAFCCRLSGWFGDDIEKAATEPSSSSI